jgi:hypothetical protein
MDEIVAGGHFGNDQPGAEGRGQASEGCIGDARHRREKDSVGDLNIAYFQRLKTWIFRAGHGFLVFLADASSRPPGRILSTNLVQSSFMPTL